jgi:hypothetical protein
MINENSRDRIVPFKEGWRIFTMNSLRLLIAILSIASCGCARRQPTAVSEPITVPSATAVTESKAESDNITRWDWAHYVVLGFPRDLVDVPFTGLRRLGFADDDTGCADDDPATPITIITITGIGAVGGVLLASAVGMSFPLSLVVIVPASAIGLVSGMYISFIIGDIGHSVAESFQVPLLRSGYDSKEYFPNWRYVLHNQTLEPTQDCSEKYVKLFCPPKNNTPGFYFTY